jgi:hypothetical protein
MGLLDGDLQASIYAGFKGKLLTGILRKRATPQSGTLDDHGDPLELVPTDHAIEGFPDNYSALLKAQAGIPDTDLKLCIFGGSIPGVEPARDDIARLGTQWYKIRKAETDPATALWVCQASRIETPQ